MVCYVSGIGSGLVFASICSAGGFLVSVAWSCNIGVVGYSLLVLGVEVLDF